MTVKRKIIRTTDVFNISVMFPAGVPTLNHGLYKSLKPGLSAYTDSPEQVQLINQLINQSMWSGTKPVSVLAADFDWWLKCILVLVKFGLMTGRHTAGFCFERHEGAVLDCLKPGTHQGQHKAACGELPPVSDGEQRGSLRQILDHHGSAPNSVQILPNLRGFNLHAKDSTCVSVRFVKYSWTVWCQQLCTVETGKSSSKSSRHDITMKTETFH